MALSASLFLRFCIQYSTIALLWYDYGLTWTREVQYIWTKRFTLSTLLYVLCRYGMVANVLYTFAIADKLPTMSCDAGYRICAILSVLGRIGIITVWGSRTYAVFNRSKVILVIFGSLELVVIGLSILHVPYVSCARSTTKEPFLSRVAVFMVIYEVASAVLTSVRSVQALNRAGPWKAQQDSLMFLILREGLIYFGFITSLTVLSLVCQVGAMPGVFFPRLMNAHALPLSGFMTARFLLHLREWDHHMSNPETDQWDIPGGGDHRSVIQFKKSEPHTTRWTINDVLGDDPLLKPVESEVNLEHRTFNGSSTSRTGY